MEVSNTKKHFYAIGVSYLNADLKTRGDFSLSLTQKDSLTLEAKREGIEEIQVSVNKYRPQMMARLRDRLQTKLDEMSAEVDPQRLEQELVFAAQKLDVTEELDRLKAHIEEVKAVLNRDEAIGRRLDFLMQELNREANTLGSKSYDTETSKNSVDLKVLIEQMREQVQNIE